VAAVAGVVAARAVEPPDEVVLQAVAPGELLGLLPGWIRMLFLPCPALPVQLSRLPLQRALLLPVVKAAVVAVEEAVAVAGVLHRRDHNLQLLDCSF
jgi:hypothetical protein